MSHLTYATSFQVVYEAGAGYSAIMKKEIVLNLEMRFSAHKRGKCNTFVYFFSRIRDREWKNSFHDALNLCFWYSV
jgi:hypothetical protein